MAFDIGSIGSKASGMFNSFGDSLKYLVPITLILAVFSAFFYKFLFYKYPVKIYRLRGNGQYKIFNTRGGFITRKTSAPYFKVVLDKFGFKTKAIHKAPSMDAITPNDTVIFIQVDVDTFIQAREVLDLNENLIKIVPIETDVKYGAVLDIQSINSALEEKNSWTQYAPTIALAVIFTACIVGWYMLMKAKCP